jgi:hypothetical protein
LGEKPSYLVKKALSGPGSSMAFDARSVLMRRYRIMEKRKAIKEKKATQALATHIISA